MSNDKLKQADYDAGWLDGASGRPWTGAVSEFYRMGHADGWRNFHTKAKS